MSGGGGVESQCSWRFHHLAGLGSSILAPCKNQSKDDMLSPLMNLDGLCTGQYTAVGDLNAQILYCPTENQKILLTF
jgi:hypothetical protein